MKYEITNIEHPHTPKLHRIRALKDFGDVNIGDLGGYVEHEYNLSQEGDCWIFGDAMVYENAKVSDDAMVFGGAEIHGESKISGNCKIHGESKISGNTKIIII